MDSTSALVGPASTKTPTPLAHAVVSGENGVPSFFQPQNLRVRAEEIEKRPSSKLATPILCKPATFLSAITDVQTQSPPPRPAPPPGLLNSHAKTARKSAHIPSSRGDGYSTSSSNGGKKPVHTHQSTCAKTVDKGQETEHTLARLANGAETARKDVSPANAVATPQPRVQPSPPQQLQQNSPQAGRRGVVPQPLAPGIHLPPQMAGRKRPILGLTDEVASKSVHMKTPTKKATAAQDPATTAPGNGSATKKRNPRKRPADKPSEGPAKKPRTKTPISGTDVFSVRKGLPVPRQRFAAHDLPPAPPALPISRDQPMWSAIPPKPPTYKVPPFRGTIPPRDQTNGAGQRVQTLLPPGTPVAPRPGLDGINRPANPDVVPQNRAPDVISISSSPMSSPALSDSSLEAVDPRKPSTSCRNLPITIEDSGSDTGGLPCIRDGAPENFIKESCTLSPSSTVSAPREGKNGDSAISTTEDQQIARFVNGLESHLQVAIDHVKKHYASNPAPEGYSTNVIDEYLNGKGKLPMIERFRFLLCHLRVYTLDGRVMRCSEACYEGISPREGRFALIKYLDVWGLERVYKPLKEYHVQAVANTTAGAKEPEAIKSAEESSLNSSGLPPSRLDPCLSDCEGSPEFCEIIGESSNDRPNTRLPPSGAAFQTECRADEVETCAPTNPRAVSDPIARSTECGTRCARGTSSPVDSCAKQSVTTHQPVFAETTGSKLIQECGDFEVAIQSSERDTPGIAASPPQAAVPLKKPLRERFSSLSVEEFVMEIDSATESRSKKLFLSGLLQPNDPISKRISLLREEESTIYKELDGMLAKSRQMESEFAGRLENTKTIGDSEDGLPDGGPELSLGGSARSFKVDWEAYWKVLREQQDFRETLGRQQDKLVGRASRIHDERMDLIQLRGDRAAMEAESARLSPSTIRGDTGQLSPGAIKPETAQLERSTSGAEAAQLPPNAIEATSEHRESVNPTAVPQPQPQPPPQPSQPLASPTSSYTRSRFSGLSLGSSIGQELLEGLKTWATFPSFSGAPPQIDTAGAPSGYEAGSKPKKRKRRVRN